jgi:hypothetical protein
MKGLIRLTALAATALALTAAPAAASVTIGQTEPTAETCVAGYDWVQPTVTSGNSYVVPAAYPDEVISSWSTNENAFQSGVLALKVFRPVSGSVYMAVGHDTPRVLTPGVLNTFSGISLPVKPGDLLGLHAGSGNPACIFDAIGDAGLYDLEDLSDGQSGTFQPDADDRLNITAVVSPSNTFSLGSVTRNRKSGTAKLNLIIPNPGELTASGKGVKAASGATTSKAVNQGQAQLLIKAKGKKKRRLNQTGTVKLSLSVAYTPTGGNTSSQATKVKLRKKI